MHSYPRFLLLCSLSLSPSRKKIGGKVRESARKSSQFMNSPFGGLGSPASNAIEVNKDRKMQSAEQLVLDLSNPDLRENALLELSKKRELFQDLAPLLWNSFGTIAALLQEIVSIYPVLSPPNLTPAQSNRVCNALALLQCVASHPDTRMLFLNAHIPLYLYPFLNTTSKSRPFEYLRLTSLGVIGALVKVDDTEVISFLLSTEIIPLCLRTMEMGSELSKTVATFIVQKILLDDVGLDYICTTAERFFAVGRVLGNMVAALAEQPSSRLLKHIIRCYLRLSDNPRACDALRSCLPDMLRDATFRRSDNEKVATAIALQCPGTSGRVTGWRRIRTYAGELNRLTSGAFGFLPSVVTSTSKSTVYVNVNFQLSLSLPYLFITNSVVITCMKE
ncbi:hypothetical protein HYC85_011430 [Camellia sinensis]|uniref:Uncharacterized protein n=1 Tax=Camellia sinensis TaxID=4442 RepID=A0A7J7HA90_CAMSI|nr:hypothetical protein HYC85_011430 [Camellia sinensis]